MSNSDNHRNSSTNKMLIDATHPEETRVVVLRNGRVEEFDYESAARKLLRGNIYLAKVTRVEPSLQAAFVDYGGNRHGFLAFNEIHPDYYQIPIADRRALIEAEAAAEAEEEAEVERAAQASTRRRQRPQRGGQRGDRSERSGRSSGDQNAEDNALDVTHLLPPEEGDRPSEHGGHIESGPSVAADDQPRTLPESTGAGEARYSEPYSAPSSETSAPASDAAPAAHDHAHGEGHHTHDHAHDHTHTHDHDANGGPRETREEPSYASEVETIDSGNGGEAEQVETVASESEDALEEMQQRPRRRLRSYKIQEVIKRRQVILVQVVKEERGTKGAALTSYLSLAGRYTVLMPNTARGGGISRKITNAVDRKRLKAIADELEVEEGMGLIIRTAGSARTKQEIKRDYEYLMRLWESVREVTLASVAPTLVYEEGNLIKRSIRDLYGKDVEEVVVAGEVAHGEALDFMRMLMPSHAKNVHNYKDSEPLFSRYQIERQLNAMFSPYVHLRSGGYLVINQTEALVSVDINSGKSTREFSIEETAHATNLEAADEIARQLKLRDLAGLIVIDFIDMEEKRNNRSVERRLKDALRFDRARIQVGHISHFGLLEMSRQRLRTGVLEGSTTQCPHCQGTGIIRSTESVALSVLRGLEDALMTGQPSSLIASTTATVALYILNHKRVFITEMEARYGITIQIIASDKLQGANFNIERVAIRRDEPVRRIDKPAVVSMDWGFDGESDAAAAEEPAGVEDEPVEVHSGRDGRDGDRDGAADGEQGADGSRRRRRRRGRGRRDDAPGGAPRQQDGGRDRADRPHGDRAPLHQAHGEAADGFREDAPVDAIVHEDHRGGESLTAGETAVEGAVGEPRRGGRGPQREGGEGGEEGSRGRRGRRRGRRGGRRGQNEGGPEGDRPRLSSGQAPGETSHEHGGAGDHDHAGHDHAGHDHGDHQHGHDHAVHDQAAHAATPMAEPVVATDVAPPSQDEAPRRRREREPRPERAERHPEPVAIAPAPVQAVVEPEPIRAVPAAEPAPVPEPVAVVPPPSPRRAPVASEPVLERVVVGPAASDVAPVVEDTRPARRGWWQRK